MCGTRLDNQQHVCLLFCLIVFPLLLPVSSFFLTYFLSFFLPSFPSFHSIPVHSIPSHSNSIPRFIFSAVILLPNPIQCNAIQFHKARLLEMARLFGAVVVSDFSDEVTHVVTRAVRSEGYILPARPFKYFYGLITGKWVLAFECLSLCCVVWFCLCFCSLCCVSLCLDAVAVGWLLLVVGCWLCFVCC